MLDSSSNFYPFSSLYNFFLYLTDLGMGVARENLGGGAEFPEFEKQGGVL